MSDPIVTFDEVAVRGEFGETRPPDGRGHPERASREEADDLRRRPLREGRQSARPAAPATTSEGSSRPPPPGHAQNDQAQGHEVRHGDHRAPSARDLWEEAMIEMYLAGASAGENRGRPEILWGSSVSAATRLQPQRQGVRGGRGVEEQAAHLRLPLRLRRRHLPEARMGRLLRERGRDGGHRRQRRRLPRGHRRRRGVHRVRRVLEGAPFRG